MYGQKWSQMIVVFSFVLVTHLGMYFLGYHSKKVESCIKYIHLKEAKDPGFGAKKDGQIHVGVAILNELLSEDEEKNQQFARTFIVKNNYQLFRVEKDLLPGHNVFVFKLLEDKNKLTSK